MKTVTIMLIALGVSVVTSSFTGSERPGECLPDTGRLTVSVSGIPSVTGDIYVLVFDQPAGFPSNRDKAYKVMKCKVSAGSQRVMIDNLPPGKYAVVVFHDKNQNETFDRNWFGIPKEAYGFTNIPTDYCGTPSFEQTSFRFSGGDLTVNVQLID